MDGVQAVTFKAALCPATSWANAAWTAYTVVNWFLEKLVNLVSPYVTFYGQNSISNGALHKTTLGELAGFWTINLCNTPTVKMSKNWRFLVSQKLTGQRIVVILHILTHNSCYNLVTLDT